jgi:hypothetical protein
MYWLPYTGSLPAALAWSGAATVTTSLAVAALIGAGRVLLLAFTAARQDRSVSVPFNPVPLDEVQEVKQAAA